MNLCFLPALIVGDEDKNPFVAWTQTTEGKLRFKRVIHLVTAVLLDPKTSDSCCSSLVKFITEVSISNGAKETKEMNSVDYAEFARSILTNPKNRYYLIEPPEKASASRKQGMLIPLYDLPSMFDFVSLLRYFLLYLVAGPAPIPSDAESMREACVPETGKRRAGILLRLAWDLTLKSDVAQGRMRFFIHILTVPLLVWKLDEEALSFLLSPEETNSLIPPFISMILVFGEQYATNDQSLNTLLPSKDVPLELCPATNTQCLLANIVQIGRLCRQVNGSSSRALNFEWGCSYVDLLALLLDAIPIRTFSARETAVEWVSDGKGRLTPIVLSIVVLDQCKAMFVDSFVRSLVSCSTDAQSLGIDKTLQSKNDKDKQMEKELADEGGSSATNLAAKEARVDRNQSFWNSSRWARKMSKGVVGLLSSGSAKEREAAKNACDEKASLTNTSSLSRSLASGSGSASASSATPSRADYSPEFFISLCRAFSVVASRWGGGGGKDEIRGKAAWHGQKSAAEETSTATPEAFVQQLLSVLCYSTQLIRAAWCLIQSNDSITRHVHTVIDHDSTNTPIRQLTCTPSYQARDTDTSRGASVLYIFTAALEHALVVTDDVEIHELEKPLPLHQLRRVIKVQKKLLYRACFVDTKTGPPNHFGLALISSTSRAFRDLYDRSSRRPLAVPKVWLVAGLLEKEIKGCKTHSDFLALLKSEPVLRICPMLVSFKRRLELFDKIVKTNREELQGVNSPNPFNPNPLKPARVAVINRGRILEDGLATMNNLGSNMRERIAVHYVNEAGVKETGIDAGGLFKEFWTDLCNIAFDPNYALFQMTEDGSTSMFPSPMSSSAHGPDHVVLFGFLGRILGKSLYEGITIQPLFAHFFLSFLRGDYNFLHMLPDLSTIDSQLYNNLMFLKTYDGDATDLCLTFTITSNEFGGTREIPLMSGGAEIEVNNANKQRYIHMVSKYYVHDRVKVQSEAFTRGLWEVIDPTWLRLFNEPELQVLISGASDGKIDLDDLRRHTRYAGGFTGMDRTISRFWSVFSSLNGKQQAAVLRFVTSCERPPPLGFASLNPPFTIQRVGILRDGDKLPSSSTCFNILKLPTYSSERVLKERLIYAVESGAGFELT